ncbi:NTP transferase domain-containing protein [Clavibacter zhangzhiyongii]|uniref:NTP transferase domain-containing protein n=1 Tax=Clavibacter zhangzhiyongii TaxID=2768071 RepID=A0A7L7Z5E6_9MICO|nr:NTP transferase domain-containing protein [Clavibacter zhangzhiyongii]QOD44829.1 NTP transferase domain-containing protein [Clavibacter zhangzhiyongii]
MSAGPAVDARDAAAVILAGGRATRLCRIDKTALARDGVTLLAGAVRAAAGCARTVVVGAGNRAGGVPRAHQEATGSALLVDEDPPYGGPAAALGAGVAALGDDPACAWILVLAADLPHAAAAVAALLPLRRGSGVDGHDALVARDPDGRAQPLLALYRPDPLRAALDAVDRADGLAGASLRAVLAALRPGAVAHADLDARLCADVDLPADADVHGLRLLDDGIPAHGR